MKKIMIVDDHQDIIEVLKKIVTKLGYDSNQAIDGKQFLTKVEKYKPDLVLLDVMMPGLTTKDILKKLKEKKLSKLKIILITVVRFSDEEKNTLIRNSNIVDYVTKPFNVKELMGIIKKHI